MTTGREVVSVSCGFWFGVMGLLVAAMVEVSFLSFFFFLLWLVVVSGYGGCGWMWRCLSTVNFFSLFFVSGGCGMGGGFLVGGWCRWCREKERETEEREIGERGKIKIN